MPQGINEFHSGSTDYVVDNLEARLVNSALSTWQEFGGDETTV